MRATDNKIITAMKNEIKQMQESLLKYQKMDQKRSKLFFSEGNYRGIKSNWDMLLKNKEAAIGQWSRVEEYKQSYAVSAIKNDKQRMSVMDSYDSYFNNNATVLNNLGNSRFMGYPFLASLAQDAMMSKGITIISDELTREWGSVVTADSDSDDKNIDFVNKKLRELKTPEKFRKAAVNAGFFGGCLVYVDIVDDNTGAQPNDADLETPLFIEGDADYNRKKLAPFKIRGLVPVEPINIGPGEFNSTNPLKDDFYEPSHFFILGKKVHRSRFLYFIDTPAPQILKPVYMFFGIPMAQLAFDFVTDFYSNKDAVSRIVKKFSLLIFAHDAMNSLSVDGGLDKRIATIAKQRDNDSIVVMDAASNEAMQQINTPLSGLKEIWYANLELLPIIFGLTKTKLLQTTPGGLNSTGEFDTKSYYEAIATKQKVIFGDPIKRLIDMICYSSEIDPNNMKFEFNSLDKLSKKDIAEINKSKAETDRTYYEMGAISNVDVAKRIAGDENSGYGGIEIPEIKEVNGGEGDVDIEKLLAGTDVSDEDNFEEDKHKRDEDGKFATTSGTSNVKTAEQKIDKDKNGKSEEGENKVKENTNEVSKKNVEEVMGERFEGFKGSLL
jgi:Uncharacterized protein conserved in bacteria